ncbi:ATP-binding protein [Streptococcus gordonii]|jgi:abi-alpha protein, putative|uniref:Abi-alpha protein, putative n=3 Tax=Streptococcus gordonii TaxID=1302 RepID=A8AX98_STRGC|nr:ATP-binding protein [Streptococcus gordonii]ABV09925.1 Abi-alpha protein, putative [Streptococcus gordonii str. Challis substr. CH1]MBZ2115747.1 ATP-binding protein [Streptococcus gordonii]MBZ2138128.1 ATP-binding protein [Streptococcus gordonii]MCY7139759.1 ATP-binding protein [Streptococcus gordonii]QGS43478.1 ATP-binding protein [Streptococcus gordonii]
MITKLLNTPEDEYHDFKQKWHSDNSELVRDILNFVNTIHHEDCYIIFGVSDNGDIIGLEEDSNRKNTETLSDLLHKLYLSTNTQISVKVESISIKNKEIDILTIFNTDLVPVYLTRDYKPKGGKGLSSGLIYSRTGAINTPRNESTSFEIINSLFKKHNKLDTSIQEQYKKVLTNVKNWSYIENEEGSFFIYNINPDFYMRFYKDSQNRYQVEAYSLSQIDYKIGWYMLELRYRNLIIDERLLNFLDGGRALVPSPNLSSISIDLQDASYYYLYKNSLDYLLLEFLSTVFPVNDRYSIRKFKESIVILDNEEEKDELHSKLNSIMTSNQIEDYILPSDDEIEKWHKRLIRKFPKISVDEVNYMLKQTKTTQLLNDINLGITF